MFSGSPSVAPECRSRPTPRDGRLWLPVIAPMSLRSMERAVPDTALSPPGPLHPIAWVGGAAAGVLIAATFGLWAYYGTAVFFEMIAAGIAACF